MLVITLTRSAAMRLRLFSGVLLFLCVSVPLRAEEFACYVRFPTAKPSIVLVETATAANAAKVASRARSKGPVRQREHVKEVVECIHRLTGQFADPAVQRMFENLPL
jgi:hypothetical protein